MTPSVECYTLIQHFEDCVLTAYPDPASPLGIECTKKRTTFLNIPNWRKIKGDPWTIGWGHTGRDVFPNKKINQTEADRILVSDVAIFARDVDSLVKVPITQKQFDALVSFAFNVGSDIDADNIAEGLGDSTLLKRLNAGNVAAAADQFLLWNKAGGKVLRGLVRRRTAERMLFLGAPVEGAIHIGTSAA